MKTAYRPLHPALANSSLTRGALSLISGATRSMQLHAVELGPDVAEPVPDIAAQHERIIGGAWPSAPLLATNETYGTDASSTCSQAISLSFGMVMSWASLIFLK